MKLPELSVEEFIRRVRELPWEPHQNLFDMIQKDIPYCFMGDPCITYTKDTTTTGINTWRYIAIITDKPFALWLSSTEPEKFKQLQEAAKNNFELKPPFDPYTDKIILPTFTDSVGISLERTICEQVSSEELIQAGRNLAKWLQQHSGPSFIKGLTAELKQDC
jgi:hypothetical protein